MKRLQKKPVHEGDYAAEVEVNLIEADKGWSPYLALEDAEKLDNVREALRKGHVTEAAKLARIFYLTPVFLNETKHESEMEGFMSEKKEELYVERRPQGDYAVRRPDSQRASTVEDTQAKAIDSARKLEPGAAIHVERVRHTSKGKPDKWRKP